MARKVSFSALESRTARLRLKVRRRPYSGPSWARGVALLYRRNKTNGTWVLKASDGHGAYWTKAIALADDFEDSDGKSVLAFYEAQDAAKRLARGDGDGSGDTAPITVDGPLRAYRADLTARQSNPYNADWPRVHLTSVLLAKPVALLTATELKRWREACWARWPRARSTGWADACAPRWNWPPSTTSASRTGKRGKPDLPTFRTPSKPATSF